ncbi:MAG: tRNA pseudouridine(55) synthase, partial [Candidatus Wallbacteria bacterium]|nr:tRNA pseudouridine(55) synthase [Candidatus Wallbacteria bacterium]
MQRPHRVSAVRVGGKRLYERAHAGQPIPEPQARPITIHRLHR